jgi:hypothetical protein
VALIDVTMGGLLRALTRSLTTMSTLPETETKAFSAFAPRMTIYGAAGKPEFNVRLMSNSIQIFKVTSRETAEWKAFNKLRSNARVAADWGAHAVAGRPNSVGRIIHSR